MRNEWYLQTVPFAPLTEKNAFHVISKRNWLFIVMVSDASDLYFRRSKKYKL
jgi:hypothetical protein